MRGEIPHGTHVKSITAEANVGQESLGIIFCRCPGRRTIRGIDESHHGLTIKQGTIPLRENVEDEYSGSRVGAIGGDRLSDAARFSSGIDLPLSKGSTNQRTSEKHSGAKMVRGAVRHHASRHNAVPCRAVWHSPSRRSINLA